MERVKESHRARTKLARWVAETCDGVQLAAQRDSFGCGPVAVYNALRHMLAAVGKPTSLTPRAAYAACDACAPGCTWSQLEAALDSLAAAHDVGVLRARVTDWADVYRHLNRNGVAIVLATPEDTDFGHFMTLLPGRRDLEACVMTNHKFSGTRRAFEHKCPTLTPAWMPFGGPSDKEFHSATLLSLDLTKYGS